MLWCLLGLSVQVLCFFSWRCSFSFPYLDPSAGLQTQSSQRAVAKICQFIIYLITAGYREVFIQKHISGNVQVKVCASAPSDAWMFWIKKIYLLWGFCVGEESSGFYLNLKIWKRRGGIRMKCKMVCLKKKFRFFLSEGSSKQEVWAFNFLLFLQTL